MLLIGIKWMLSIIISCDEECQARFTAKPETLVIFALQLCHLLFCVREKGRNIGFSVYLSVRVTRAECGSAKYFKFPVDLLLREGSRKEKHLYLGETTLSQPHYGNFSCEFHLFAKWLRPCFVSTWTLSRICLTIPTWCNNWLQHGEKGVHQKCVHVVVQPRAHFHVFAVVGRSNATSLFTVLDWKLFLLSMCAHHLWEPPGSWQDQFCFRRQWRLSCWGDRTARGFGARPRPPWEWQSRWRWRQRAHSRTLAISPNLPPHPGESKKVAPNCFKFQCTPAPLLDSCQGRPTQFPDPQAWCRH